MLKNRKGFSLVELIVVIAIMAVLVGILAPTLITYVEKSRKQKDESAAEELRNAVELSLSDEDVYETLPAATFTLTFKNASDKITVAKDNIEMATDVEACREKIAANISQTITEVAVTSKAYKGKNIKITLEYKEASTSFVVKTAEFVS